jgi:hypothetical protein
MVDRKYRHSGYQDGGSREERPRERPKGPPPAREGPRGRGLGAPTVAVFRCRNCGGRLELIGAMAADATCSGCGQDLHSCTSCIAFDPGSPNECRKDVPTRVPNKAKRNTCELFAPRAVQEFAPDAPAPSSDPRAAFDALFKK